MVQKIPLKGRIQGGASLRFLSVEVPVEPDRIIPFALVRYSIEDAPQEKGLRLDLDKCTFADHLEGERERVLQNAGKQIVQVVAQELRHQFFEAIRSGAIKE